MTVSSLQSSVPSTNPVTPVSTEALVTPQANKKVSQVFQSVKTFFTATGKSLPSRVVTEISTQTSKVAKKIHIRALEIKAENIGGKLLSLLKEQAIAHELFKKHPQQSGNFKRMERSNTALTNYVEKMSDELCNLSLADRVFISKVAVEAFTQMYKNAGLPPIYRTVEKVYGSTSNVDYLGQAEKLITEICSVRKVDGESTPTIEEPTVSAATAEPTVSATADAVPVQPKGTSLIDRLRNMSRREEGSINATLQIATNPTSNNGVNKVSQEERERILKAINLVEKTPPELRAAIEFLKLLPRDILESVIASDTPSVVEEDKKVENNESTLPANPGYSKIQKAVIAMAAITLGCAVAGVSVAHQRAKENKTSLGVELHHLYRYASGVVPVVVGGMTSVAATKFGQAVSGFSHYFSAGSQAIKGK